MGRSGVAGKLTSKNIAKQIKAGGGKAMLTTVERGKLTATMQDGKLVLTDEEGWNTHGYDCRTSFSPTA